MGRVQIAVLLLLLPAVCIGTDTPNDSPSLGWTGGATLMIDAHGGRAIDWAAGRSLTLSNSPTYSVGRQGWATTFNGTSQSIIVPNGLDPYLIMTNNFTVTMWARPSEVSATLRNLLFKEGLGGNFAQYGILYNYSSAGKWLGQSRNNAGGALSVNGGATMVSNTWYHFAIVVSGGTLSTYQNGVATGNSSAVCAPTVTNLTVTIGADLKNARYWYGMIDTVRIYNRPLSDMEIKNDYGATF